MKYRPTRGNMETTLTVTCQDHSSCGVCRHGIFDVEGSSMNSCKLVSEAITIMYTNTHTHTQTRARTHTHTQRTHTHTHTHTRTHIHIHARAHTHTHNAHTHTTHTLSLSLSLLLQCQRPLVKRSFTPYSKPHARCSWQRSKGEGATMEREEEGTGVRQGERVGGGG